MTTPQRRAMLHDAVTSGGVAEVLRLLSEERELANCAAPDDQQGLTPLMRAARHGQVEVARLLLDRGADADRVTSYGWSAVHFAVGSFVGGGVLRLLLQRGAKLHSSKELNGGATALMIASSMSTCGADDLRALLRAMRGRGGAVDEEDGSGRTALWQACRWGHTEAVRVLLRDGGAEASPEVWRMSRGRATAFGDEGAQEALQVLEWWEGELSRAEQLARARAQADRRLQTAAPQQTTSSEVQGSLRDEPQEYGGGKGGAQAVAVQQEDGGEEGAAAGVVAAWVVHGLQPDLFRELMEMMAGPARLPWH